MVQQNILTWQIPGIHRGIGKDEKKIERLFCFLLSPKNYINCNKASCLSKHLFVVFENVIKLKRPSLSKKFYCKITIWLKLLTHTVSKILFLCFVIILLHFYSQVFWKFARGEGLCHPPLCASMVLYIISCYVQMSCLCTSITIFLYLTSTANGCLSVSDNQ